MKYKDHMKLGISFAEFGALLGTRAMLASSVLTQKDGQPNAHRFDMATSCRVYECASVSCIGGTMGLIMFKGNADEADSFVYESVARFGQNPTVWSELFFPGSVSRRQAYVSKYTDFYYEKITPKESIKAIDAFLSGKKRLWAASVLKKIRKPTSAL